MAARKTAAKKKDVRSLMRRQLGKETADAMLKKLDKMAKKGASVGAIEKVVAKDISKHAQKVRRYLRGVEGIYVYIPRKGSK